MRRGEGGRPRSEGRTNAFGGERLHHDQEVGRQATTVARSLRSAIESCLVIVLSQHCH